jgi:hypothetical protein
MTPQEREQLFLDTLTENERAVWMGLEGVWNSLAQVARAAQAQGRVTPRKDGRQFRVYEWNEVPLEIRGQFSQAIQEDINRVITLVGATCVLLDSAENGND